jgi:hypothetical protein
LAHSQTVKNKSLGDDRKNHKGGYLESTDAGIYRYVEKNSLGGLQGELTSDYGLHNKLYAFHFHANNVNESDYNTFLQGVQMHYQIVFPEFKVVFYYLESSVEKNGTRYTIRKFNASNSTQCHIQLIITDIKLSDLASELYYKEKENKKKKALSDF